jgi:hypothetical protein
MSPTRESLFPLTALPVGRCYGYGLCSLWGRYWIVMYNLKEFQSSRAAPWLSGLVAASRHTDLSAFHGQSTVIFVLDKLQLRHFPPSTSLSFMSVWFHQCSFIFTTLIMLLSEGRAGEALKSSKKAICLGMSGNRQEKLSLVSNCAVLNQGQELSGYLLDNLSKNEF